MCRASSRATPRIVPSPSVRWHSILLGVLITACAHPAPSDGNAEAPVPRREGGNVIATSDDIQRSPNEPVEKYLQGRSAGVDVSTTSDGGISVRIRGAGLLLGNNEPLYILDGVPFAPGANGSLVGINPYDIASIRVLKDAADITMYGVRGANGVIVIKTRSARQ